MSQPSFRMERWAASLLVLLSFLFPVQPAPIARAAGIRYAKPAATGAGDCSTWDNACDLQTALTNAASGDEIWVAAGTYKPTTGTDRAATFQLKSGVGVYGGFAMTETLRSQRNITANVTVLSGDIGTVGNSGDNSYHVVTGSGVASTAVLDGFTVTGGNANGTPWPDFDGGGMLNSGGSPTLTNVTVSGNEAMADGGGMFNDQSSPSLTNVTFSGNSVQYYGGGGGGMLNSLSSPTLTNVTFSGNSTTNHGGGMDNYKSSPTLTNVTFSGNWAQSGGGMYNYQSSPTIRNTILWGNTASNGAQVYNDSSAPSSTPDIRDSVVQGGCPAGSTCTHIITADPRLGALGNYGGSTLTFPLLPGSPAFDAGNDAACPSTDQRGVARPQGTHCDIGAYESRGFTLTKTGGDHQTAPLYVAFAQPLSITLNETGGSGLAGVTLTFTAPFSGASANLSSPTATTDSGGSASVNATANGILGSYPVTVTASGVITPVTFVLANTANTLMAVSASLNPSTLGQTVTFTATVSAVPGSGTPSGSVAFKDNGTTIPGCGAQALNGSGQAMCATSSLTVGPHSVSAEYSGDGMYYSASVSAYPQIVIPGRTTTTITSSANPSLAGSAVTFTVTVTSPYGTPTGTVDFYETTSPAALSFDSLRGSGRAQALAGQPLVGGVVTFTGASLAAGTHRMLAIYSGDTNYNPSTSAQYAQVVNPLPLYALTVNTADNGSGTVLKSPDAISYTAGTVVTVTATPDTGSTFGGWSSNCAVVSADCVVTMTTDTTVTATFTLNTPMPNTYTLVVNTAGNGSGTVIKSPDQISYTAGTVVTVTAAPGSASVFAGWSGAAVTTTSPLVLTMDANKSVTATFITYQVYLPAVFKP